MENKKKSEFDQMVEEIQKDLDDDAKATFSKTVLNECRNPQHIGRMKLPNTAWISMPRTDQHILELFAS